MLYYKTIWNHTNDYDPIIMYSEIDEERYETKRLEIYHDGEVAYFDTRTPMELSEAPYPSDFDTINATDEFDVSEISSIDFENILKMYDTNALIVAGVPRNQWHVTDNTGSPLHEKLLDEQLLRNKLTSEGISTVRRSGGTNNGK